MSPNTKQPRVVVVIPTYNESENIRKLVSEIFSRYPQFEIFAVDDNSPDGTGKILESLEGPAPALHVARRAEKLGIGSAHLLGLKYAVEKSFDFAVTMDADFSHDPVYISELVKSARDFDLVIGSRHIEEGGFTDTPFFRILFSKFSNFLLRLALGDGFRDYTSGFRCYSVKALVRSSFPDSFSGGYSFLVETLHFMRLSGFSVLETPIIFKYRKLGKSKISFREILGTLLTALKLFLRRFLPADGGVSEI